MRVTKGLHERNHFARRHFIFLHAAALSNVVTLPGILSPAALAAETITDRDFDVMVPDGFVRLPRTGRATSNFLLVTGNFATGSTFTVELLDEFDMAKLMPATGSPFDTTTSEALATSLMRRRDKSSGLDAESALRATGMTVERQRLQFEFDTPLVLPQSTDPALTRRTLASVLLLPPSGESQNPRALVLWAGATLDQWLGPDQVGQKLMDAASTFRLVLVPADI